MTASATPAGTGDRPSGAMPRPRARAVIPLALSFLAGAAGYGHGRRDAARAARKRAAAEESTPEEPATGEPPGCRESRRERYRRQRLERLAHPAHELSEHLNAAALVTGGAAAVVGNEWVQEKLSQRNGQGPKPDPGEMRRASTALGATRVGLKMAAAYSMARAYAATRPVR